ncbi:MAG: histidine kinase, partial [Urechidicola sp.]|nr:histidine kinase [Urechidicola sp.]
LISSVLLKFGLASATEDLCEKYSNSRLVFNCDSKSIKRYNESFEIRVHNIIDELVNNILKHSNANMASIILEEKNDVLKIEISDNGDGFSLREVSKKDGLGLSQIKARIKMMKGTFKIKSSKNEGTRIYLSIPIPE